ncbi:substrate-binding periplasmic protein [Candidatus Margulisiibacteriota bacterium]
MIKKILQILLLFMLILASTNSLLFAASSNIDDYEFMTEIYPPFQYMDKKGNLTGSSVDLLALVLQELKSAQTTKDFKVLPWARSYKIIQRKPNKVLFAMTVTPERSKLFKWAGPTIKNIYCVIAKKNRKIKIKKFKQLLNYKVAVIRDDIGEQLLVERGYPKNKLHLNSNPEYIIEQLEKGFVDMWSYSNPSASWIIKEAGRNPDDYEIVYIITEKPTTYAFSKQTPDPVIKKMNKAWNKIKKSSHVKAIIKKYNYLPGQIK